MHNPERAERLVEKTLKTEENLPLTWRLTGTNGVMKMRNHLVSSQYIPPVVFFILLAAPMTFVVDSLVAWELHPKTSLQLYCKFKRKVIVKGLVWNRMAVVWYTHIYLQDMFLFHLNVFLFGITFGCRCCSFNLFKIYSWRQIL